MSKRCLLISIAIIVLLVFMIKSWNKPTSGLTKGEVKYKEVTVEDLNLEYQSLISNFYDKTNSVYLIHSHGGSSSEPFPVLVYSNLHRGKNLYSYPKTSVKRENDIINIYIKDEDALNDDQTKDTLVLLVETLPPPAAIKVYYNNQVFQPQVRAFPIKYPILKSDIK